MRLALWTGGLLLGIVVALFGEATPRAAIAAGVPAAALACGLLARRRRPWAELVVSLAIGGYAGARATEAPGPPVAVAAIVDEDGPGRQVSLDGWVVAGPEPVSTAESAGQGARQGSRLRVRASHVDGAPVPAERPLTVGVSVANGVPQVLPGDPVRFAARLRSVRGLANPGVPDGTVAARAAGIDVFAGVGVAAAIQTGGAVSSAGASGAPAGLSLLRAAALARQELGRAIDDMVPGTAGVLLHTAVLGERRASDQGVEAGFRAAGATHVLSVSGLHLAAIALVCFAGLRWLLARVPRLPLWVDVRAFAALCALPAIAFYTLITGAAVATVRSALMMTVALAGTALGRRGTAAGAIAAAVLGLLAWSPLVVVDVSFQLSLVSVVALTMLAPRLSPAAPVAAPAGARATGPRARWRALAASSVASAARWLGRMGAASVAAGLTTAPLVAHAFGEVAPAGPVGNLILVPLIELVVVPFGLVGAVMGALGGATASRPLLAVAAWAARGALVVAEAFRVHAPLWLTRSPGVFETAGLSLGFACALWGWRGGTRGRRGFLGAGAILIAAAVGGLAAQELGRRTTPDLVVTFLDVGQGDAAVIQGPGGRTVLIDAGGTYDGSFDPGARVIEPFLRARGITRLDLLVLSHPHPDHMGGMHRLLGRFPVGALWTSGDDGRNPDYHQVLREAAAAAVPTPVPDRWHAGGLTLEPLGPFVTEGTDGRGEHIGPTAGVSVNDASLVVRAAFGARSLLFTGDIEADGEGELAGRTSVGQVVAADVLKVPHHGSRTSSSSELLDSARPGLAVMSLGWRNRFRFPRPEVVDRYRARGIRLLRTDLHGAITVTISPGGSIATTCARGCGQQGVPSPPAPIQ